MNPTILYTLSRLALLIVGFGLSYVAGLRGALLIVVAFLGSSVVSFFLLNNQRNAMGERVQGFFTRLNNKIDENSRKEDVD